MRTEIDFLGSVELDDSTYYGISTYRAFHNFNVSNELVNMSIIKELVNVKKQAALTNLKLKFLDKDIAEAIIKACDLIMEGKYNDSFVVNRYQGGAGTSTNMNVNEVVSKGNEIFMATNQGLKKYLKNKNLFAISIQPNKDYFKNELGSYQKKKIIFL